VKQKLKSFLFLTSCIVLLVFTIHFEAMAQEAIPGEELHPTKNTVAAAVYERNIYETAHSMEELEQEIRSNINGHEQAFSIRYLNNTSVLKAGIKSIFDEAMSQDDYFHYTIKRYSYVYKGYEGDVTISFNMQYIETKEQTDYVDSRIDEILGEIITDGMKDYQKERAIHDYIVLNVKYDTTLTEHTAYAALAKGVTVCQGYSLLAYKMLNRAGIETRIIEGTAKELHLWNLVKLDGKWYHLDCTWDDPLPNRDGIISYKFFNLSDEQISADHSWVGSYPKAS
jgi:transglutaminase-like putative cysteine protease